VTVNQWDERTWHELWEELCSARERTRRQNAENMGKRGPKAKALAPPPNLPKPEGQRTKRTPTSTFDPASGKDIYEPEKVTAKRMARGGITQYQVKNTCHE